MRIVNRRSRVIPAVLLALAAPVALAAAEVAPRRPSDVITLRSSGAPCALASFTRLFDTRVLPNGTTEPFVLPSNRVLVVTGIDWTVEGAPLGQQIQLFLYVEAVGSPVPVVSDRGDAFEAQVLRSTTISPVVVSGPLCAASNTVVGAVSGVVHGFLARDD